MLEARTTALAPASATTNPCPDRAMPAGLLSMSARSGFAATSWATRLGEGTVLVRVEATLHQRPEVLPGRPVRGSTLSEAPSPMLMDKRSCLPTKTSMGPMASVGPAREAGP